MKAGDDDWPAVGEEELGAVVAGIEPGGGRSERVRTFFQGGDAGGVVVRGGDVVTDPQDKAGP